MPPYAATRRTLASLIESEAPVRTPRAAAVMLAVSEEAVRRRSRGHPPFRLEADRVVLHADGSVELGEPTEAHDPIDDPVHGTNGDATHDATAASVGVLLIELAAGRAPIDRADAAHLATGARLAPDVVSLVVRSAGEPAHWPSLTEWHEALVEIAGAHAAPTAPGLRRARALRLVLVAVGVTALAAISAGLVVAALSGSGPPGLVVPLLHGHP